MNKISKKLLLCALLVGGIVTGNASARALADDEMIEAEIDTQDESSSAIPTPPPLPPARAQSKKPSAVTKGARKRRKRLARETSRKSRRKATRSKSNRKGKEGSRFEERRVSRRKTFGKAKATRKSRTARPRRQPKGVAQTADNERRIKSWKSGHKKTQASRKERFRKKSPTERAARARKQAEQLLDKSPWTARDYKRAQSLRKTLTTLLPRPYSLADYKFFDELDNEISAYEGTPQEDSQLTRSIKRGGRRLKHVDEPVERTGYKLGKVID